VWCVQPYRQPDNSNPENVAAYAGRATQRSSAREWRMH
jgi:hypothetical protein